MTMIRKAALHEVTSELTSDEKLTGLPLMFDFLQVKRVLESNLIDMSTEISECRGVYVRYKPATNCIAAYRAKYKRGNTGETSELIFYGKCHTVEDFALATEKVKTHEWEGNSVVKPIIVLSDSYVIFYIFPNDCEMAGLPTVTDTRKIARILYDVEDFLPRNAWRISDKRLKMEVLRYKPEKRAVVKIASRAVNRSNHSKKAFSAYLRTYSDDHGEFIFSTMKELRRALGSHPVIKVPRPLAYVKDKRFLITEGLEGMPLTKLLGQAVNEDLIKRAAEALAVMHQLKIENVVLRKTEDLMEDARATGETIKMIVPGMSEAVESILAKLQSLNSNTGQAGGGFVHGDFHCGQILVQEKGTAVLDFDRSYSGEQLIDVGNFCAHLNILGRQYHWNNTDGLIWSFVTNYETSVRKKLDKERLKLWTGFGLLLFTVYPFRSLEPDWQTSVAVTVRKCEKTLL